MGTADKPLRAVVTCMDYRIKQESILNELNRLDPDGKWNDGKGAYFLRNAGGVVTEDVVRSLLMLQKFVVKDFGIRVAVITHTECGMIAPPPDKPAENEEYLNQEIEKDPWIADRPPFALGTFPSPEVGICRSVRRLLRSWRVWVDPKGVLNKQGYLYDIANHTLRRVELYSIVNQKTWAEVATSVGGNADKIKSANPQAAEPFALDEVLYIPRN